MFLKRLPPRPKVRGGRALKSTLPRKEGEVFCDTQTSIPCHRGDEVQIAFKDWMIHEDCRSHYVSQFAAFFIVARAKRSIVKSCLQLNVLGLLKCVNQNVC